MGLHPCSTFTCGTSVKVTSQGMWSLRQQAMGKVSCCTSLLLYQLAEPYSSHPENGDSDESCHGLGIGLGMEIQSSPWHSVGSCQDSVLGIVLEAFLCHQGAIRGLANVAGTE